MKKNNVWFNAYEKGAVIPTNEQTQLPFLKIRKNFRILDIGCGEGTLLDKITKHFGAEGVGIDVVTFKRGKHAFVKSDAQFLPFKDESFDAVYGLGSIEHLESTEKAIFEAFRVLNSNGQILFSVPNTFSLHTFIERPLRQKIGRWDIGLEKSFSVIQLIEKFEKAGFKEVTYQFQPWNTTGRSFTAKSFMNFDNLLSNLLSVWGFFILIYGMK